MKTKISSHANLMLNCMYNLVGEEATFFPVKQWKWGIFEATSHQPRQVMSNRNKSKDSKFDTNS